jgi:uncharacterized damage-inducible protein DinB
MPIAPQIARHLRELHFGKNWTDSSLKDHLADVSWQEATTQVQTFNTIVALVYHINYYTTAISGVLQGQPLQSSDKLSFDHPPIHDEKDWQQLLQNMWTAAETLARQIELLPDSRLDDTFVNDQYGSYFRNLQGVIEHAHYHLGQIVLIKKWLREKSAS